MDWIEDGKAFTLREASSTQGRKHLRTTQLSVELSAFRKAFFRSTIFIFMVLAMVPANLLGHATRRNSLIDSVFHTSTIELFVECTYLFSDGFQELASSSESVASEQSVTEVNFLSMKITTKSRHRQWIGVSHFPKGRNDPENQVFGRRT